MRSREISERSAQAEIALALGMSEGGASTLIDAAEKSPATYSFAENYVVHPHMRVIRSLVQHGEFFLL